MGVQIIYLHSTIYRTHITRIYVISFLVGVCYVCV